MLTKSDLTEIAKVIRKEVSNEVKGSTRTLDSQIRLSRMEVQRDISELEDRVKNFEIKTSEEFASVNKKMSKMHKDLKKEIETVSDTLDRGNMRTERSVKRMEQHLELPLPQ